MNARLIWIIVIVVLVVVGGVVGLISILVMSIFGLLDKSDAHVCGLAFVKDSPVAQQMIGTPIEQKGFTSGNTSTNNGETTERVTFTVKGPNGEAMVVSEGRKSPMESHLDVKIGQEGHSETVYSGAFDCPALHAKGK